MEDKIKCIYGIKDKRDDKVIYIGQTGNFIKRKKSHFSDKRRSVAKYMFEQGRDNFEMFILEELNEDISKEEMRNKEQFYIEKYNTLEVGLNKNRSGNIYINDTKEYRKIQMKERYDSGKMNQYYKMRNQTEKWKQYNKEKSKELYKTEERKEYLKEYEKSEKRKAWWKQYRMRKRKED